MDSELHVVAGILLALACCGYAIAAAVGVL